MNLPSTPLPPGDGRKWYACVNTSSLRIVATCAMTPTQADAANAVFKIYSKTLMWMEAKQESLQLDPKELA